MAQGVPHARNCNTILRRVYIMREDRIAQDVLGYSTRVGSFVSLCFWYFMCEIRLTLLCLVCIMRKAPKQTGAYLSLRVKVIPCKCV